MRAFRADYRRSAQDAHGARGLVRRVRVAASNGLRWILDGYDDGDNVEKIPAEVFTGAGFASRPSAKGEALVLRVGAAATHAVVAATRDPSWDAAVGTLGEGETAIHNDAAIVRIKADGTIEIGTIGGAYQALATKADLDALAGFVATHTHADPSSGFTSAPASVSGPLTPPVASGTQKLRAE